MKRAGTTDIYKFAAGGLCRGLGRNIKKAVLKQLLS